MTTTATATQTHDGHDVWPLVSKPGVTWCRTCRAHYADDPTNPEADLFVRWLPSPEQVRLANALLAAGYDAERGERRERGVYTTHLLVNKVPGIWTTAVEVRHLDGVYLTRDAAWLAAEAAAKKLAAESGAGVVGGYAWHMGIDRAAVWEA